MRSKSILVVVIGLVILAYCSDTHATVAMDWVTVGDAGNVGELSGYSAGGFGPDRICGAVNYTYQISKYEVTNAQYCEFLNAVASTDTYSLYHTNMNGTYGGITQSGTSGSFEYSVKSGWENKPVNCVSWYDSIRFINWLQNGQGSSNTENGTYTIVDGGADSGIVTLPDHSTFSTRHFFLPTEDEWYKAAYYKGGSTDSGYWDYATQSDTVPTTGQVNYFNVPGAPTDVGSYAFPSAYNTFDQNGNMWEWNEVLIEEPVGEMRRGKRGGSWSREASCLPASDRNYNYPGIQANDVGFRVASVPEPAIGGYIDSVDLTIFSDKWLDGGCSDANYWCGFADINRDNYVDFVDFAWLAQYWEDTPPVPGQASNPDPPYIGLPVVSITADLSWTAGSDAAAHGVYFGTNPTPDANDFQGYQTSTTFDPGLMIGGTTYYWRIDEVGLGGTTTGDVWRFTTAPTHGQPRDPMPSDGASIDGLVFPAPPYNIYTLLNFTPGEGAVSHEAFFSDDEAKVIARDPTVSLGEPGLPPTTYYVGIPYPEYTPYTDSLVRGTWYYWCVDETDDQAQVWPGPVWSFYVQTDKASDPDPADGQTLVSITPVLSWVAGAGAEEHDVYFGTDPNYLPPELTQPLGRETYVPGTLDYDTTYYWRIDEVRGRLLPFEPGTVVIGDLWRFTTEPASVPGRATNPSPADTATNVSITADLSWTAGYGATSHDVYFGTNPAPDINEFKGNQTNTTFDPGTLDYQTTYYWRIDEVGPGGTITGEVWRFTTAPAPGQATNPSPADTATDVSINADLSWTAGYGATSHDVYFGTDPTPDAGEFQGNQTNTTFDPGTLDYETTYYWCIDEVGPGGTITGEVWRFTTAPTHGQPRDPMPSDGESIDGLVYPSPPYNIYTLLNFTPGEGAVSHEAFFSEYLDKVTARDPTVSLGEPGLPPTTYYVGLPFSEYTPYTDSLVRGTWYYWCVDETDDQAQVWPGPVWSFYVRTDKASDPNPLDGQRFVSLTPTLSWVGGVGVEFHDIYFGYTYDDVNDAVYGGPLFRGTQLEFDTTWEPVADGGLFLDYLTDYYWRIDEVHDRMLPTIPGTVVKGDVWGFTTLTYIHPTYPVGWWSFDEGEGSLAFDRSGHGNHGMLIDGIDNGLAWAPAEGALNFDGSNNLSRVMIPASGITTTAGTIAIWANLAELQIRDGGRNGSGYFFGCDNGGNDKILLYMDGSDTQLDMKVGNHGENNIVTLSTETWYHIALTWNAGTYAVYVNGLNLDTGSYGGLTTLPSTADIGNNGSSSTQSFHGLMGDVQVYDKSLSAAEIQQLCQDVAN